MNFLLAPNSFKNSLSSVTVAEAMEKGILSAMPQAQVFKAPFSDGGDGLVEVFSKMPGAVLLETETLDPLMRPIKSKWIVYKDMAIIETALACGLALLSFPRDKAPLAASSYGVGLLIKDAVQHGIKKIVLGLGGSATTDGASGMLSALGIRFLDKNCKEIKQGGAALLELAEIDISGMAESIRQSEFIVLTDVVNPLIGEQGAAQVFAPQKGASQEEVEILERALTKFGKVVRKKFGKNVAELSGAGAAGGMAAGTMAFLNAKIQSGAKWVAEHNGFMEQIQNADWVITGEGKLDHQTIYGKVPFFVHKVAKAHNKKVAAFGGILEKDFESSNFKFDYVDWIMQHGIALDEAIKHAEKHLERLLYNFIMTIAKS